MPLTGNIGKDVKELKATGRPFKQALAIAFSYKNKKEKK